MSTSLVHTPYCIHIYQGKNWENQDVNSAPSKAILNPYIREKTEKIKMSTSLIQKPYEASTI